MRKLAFIRKGLFFLILFCQIQIISAQEVGVKPFRECWRFENDNINSFALASDNDSNLFLSFTDGSVEAIDRKLGKSIWHSEVGGEIISPILSDSKKIYVLSRNT